MKSLYLFVTCMLTILWLPTAYGQIVSKEKKFSGHFLADKGKLVIHNRYGKLDINTWDRNEVTVDITVTAKAKSLNSVQELLDKVSIIEPKDNGSGIYYKTVIGTGKSDVTNGKFRIDYVINMPRRHTAAFTNKYGDIDIEDIDGKLEIDLEYGKLKTGAIRGNDKDIRIGFGSATIPSIETGTITASYSRLSIDKAGGIKVSNQYEKTIIGSVNDLDINQKYGDLKIGSVNQLKANIQFAGLVIDKLLKSAETTLSYCTDAKFNYIGPGADNIRVKSSFSNLSYHFDNEASLAGGIAVSFGKVNNDASNISLTESGNSKSVQASTYKMKIGSGRGNMDLKVSYGNVMFK